MLLRYDFALETEARTIEDAVNSVLEAGYRTFDIAGSSVSDKNKIIGTSEMGSLVVAEILKN